MLTKIPTIIFFTQEYWNQLGPDMYGDINEALAQLIKDGGPSVKMSMRKELIYICESNDYKQWFKEARMNPEIIRLVGGRFIVPKEVPQLLVALEGLGNSYS
jgi:hypothetical protein